MDTHDYEGDLVFKVVFLQDNVKYSCKSARVKDRNLIKGGDKRLVRWKDGNYYNAIIKQIRSDGLINVKFTDDNLKFTTSSVNVKNFKVQAGDIRHVKWDDGRYYPARIESINQQCTKKGKYLKKCEPSSGENNKLGENCAEEEMNKAEEELHQAEEETYNAEEVTVKAKDKYKENYNVGSRNEVLYTREAAAAATNCEGEENAELKNKELVEDDNSKQIEDELAMEDLSENTEDEELGVEKDSEYSEDEEQLVEEDSENSEYVELRVVDNTENAENKELEVDKDCELNDVGESKNGELDESKLKTVQFDDNCISSTDKLENVYNIKTLRVAATNNKSKRLWDKKHCCLFCKKLITKLPRHLEQVHPNEKEVIEFSSLPPSNPVRIALLNKLRSCGNYIHNNDVYNLKHGTIIPKRRKAEPSSPSKLIPCVNCNDYFHKKTLYRHIQNCKVSNTTLHTGKWRSNVTRIAKHMLPSQHSSKRYVEYFSQNILSGMKKGSILNEINKDTTIIQFGIELYEKFEHLPHLKDHIRNKLRELARFMTEVKKINPKINELSSLLTADNFELIIMAVKTVAKFHPDTNTFEIPTLATKLGESILKCAVICRKKAILKNDSETKNNIDNFLTIYESEWSIKIASKARTTLYNARFNKGNDLPDPEDMKKLNEFLKTEIEDSLKKIKMEASTSNYIKLSKLSLASVIIFNKKRAGDAHHLTIESYLKGMKCNDNPHPEIFKKLSEQEKELVKKFTRIETRGKKGRKVPILLTPTIKEMTKALIENRIEAGVLPENNHMFAVPGTSNSFYRGSDVVREIRHNAKLKYENRITTTSLRKEAATMSAACGLNENEVDQLASFLGHDIRTHREHYRLPEATLQTAKVGNFLQDIYCGGGESIRPTECGNELMVKCKPKMPTNKNKKDNNKKKVKVQKTYWNDVQNEVLQLEMVRHLNLGTIPGKVECEKVIRENKVLESRSWKDIKFYVKNRIYKKT